MREPTFRAPKAGLDPARRHRSDVELELVSGVVVQRVLDADQALDWPLAAEAQVAAGVDDEGAVAGKALRGQIRGKSLATAACIEANAGWPCHHSCNSVDRDLAPARVRARPGRLSLWGPGQSVGDALRG